MSDSKNPKIVLDTPCAWVHALREASRGGRQAPGLILVEAGQTGAPLPALGSWRDPLIAKLTGDLESCQRNLENVDCVGVSNVLNDLNGWNCLNASDLFNG